VFCGACDCFNVPRNKILVDYMMFRNEKHIENYSLMELVKLESEYCGINFDLLEEYSKIESANTIEDLKEGGDGKYEITITINDVISRVTKTNKKYKMVVSDYVNIFVWNVAQLAEDDIQKGETLKCIVYKKGDYIQYGRVSGRIKLDRLRKLKKYDEVEICRPVDKTELIKQQELF
jgi:hypothetical protein